MIKSCFSGAVLRVGTADVLKCDFYDWMIGLVLGFGVGDRIKLRDLLLVGAIGGDFVLIWCV